jgi:hypothetical protein
MSESGEKERKALDNDEKKLAEKSEPLSKPGEAENDWESLCEDETLLAKLENVEIFLDNLTGLFVKLFYERFLFLKAEFK